MNHGTYIGIPNFRHSEPYMFLKNIKDVFNEDHNIGVRWTKVALNGFGWGSVLGYMYFIGAPAGQFEMSKLMAATGMRSFSGNGLR